MIHLKSNWLEASVDPLGAELQSLRSLKTGLEYMWEGDPAFWGKHSPVLFPIVGSLKGDTYFFEGKSYTLPRHGFARERIFAVDQVSENKAVFTLEADEESLKIYPFSFRLELIYELSEDSLYCTYAVHNFTDKVLWFSVGGHPAFKVPLISGSKYEDHYIQFNQDETLLRWHLQNGLISDFNSFIEVFEGQLPLHHSLFYDDAIVLKNLRSTRVVLGSTRHAHGIDFYFDGFPYLGIWAAKDAPFVCIEPWCGHADTLDHNQQLTEKPGIERLEPGENWERTWKVEVF
jgi:galactose mutarotase-like enzyme